MMVELMDLQPGDTICDPACGTSGFLVAAGQYLKERYLEDIFYNKEQKPIMTAPCLPVMIWIELCCVLVP